jgi:asparagine synthase (glutamine-hydrolysing)
MGFPVPIGRWLRGSHAALLDELVLGPRAQARGLFDAASLQHLVDEHRSGARDHGDRLWMLMNLEIWQRVFLDGEAPEAVVDMNLFESRLGRAA